LIPGSHLRNELAESMNNRWLRIAVSGIGWGFVGLVLTLELFFNGRAEMGWVDFWSIGIPQFGRAAMWAMMTPFILMLRERVPLSSGYWVGGVLFHIGFSFIVMATYYLARIEGASLFFSPLTSGFWETANKGFYGHNLVDMACYWAVLAFGYGSELHRKFRNEEIRTAQLESKLIEAELRALREQLKPHFFFNTLNTIAVLVRDGRNEMAVTLLARLGSLLRMSLDSSRENETPLQVEMDFLDRYLEIQKARFSDRLSVSVAVEKDALDMTVPWLLLQPIVENAILHGVAPKVGPGRVEITGSVRNGMLHLEVRDDGPGLPGDAGVAEGTGLTNTRERLKKIYGDAGRMSIHGRPSGGIAVEIDLPCRK
jgi:two-component system LytT family sensor kinase